MADFLPIDHAEATIIGRVFRPDIDGPSVVAIVDGRIIDITSKAAPTLRDVCEKDNPCLLYTSPSPRD